MKRTVWKYDLGEHLDLKTMSPYVTIEVPVASKCISVASQNDDIVVYFEVNPEVNEKEKVTFLVMATGKEFPEDKPIGRFLGTVKLYHGALMFHVYLVITE